MCCTADTTTGGGGGSDRPFQLAAILQRVREELARHGIDFDACCHGGEENDADAEPPRVKVVCVAPDLHASAKEMGASARDQVVMVRVDAQTAERLDAWVQTGAVKSRSEAAALFIREGLSVRASELDRLDDALRQMNEARERLQREARAIFGGGPGNDA